MALPSSIVVQQVAGQTIRVTQQNQVLSTQAPVTLRNTAADYNAIDRLTDVELSQRENGSTLVYNASTDKYEVKPITAAITGLDGGTF
jgi:hypothetical protein